VVGVVVKQLNALQNVNFAIQPSMLINFLEVKDVTPKIDTPKAQRTSTEVCEIAKKFLFRFTAKGFPRRLVKVLALWPCHRLMLRISAPNWMYKRLGRDQLDRSAT
jgi:hypothetical protein